MVEIAPQTPPKARMALINNMAVEDLLCLHLSLGQMTGALLAHQRAVTNFLVTAILHINKDQEAIDDLPPDSDPKVDAQTQGLEPYREWRRLSMMLSESFLPFSEIDCQIGQVCDLLGSMIVSNRHICSVLAWSDIIRSYRLSQSISSFTELRRNIRY